MVCNVVAIEMLQVPVPRVDLAALTGHGLQDGLSSAAGSLKGFVLSKVTKMAMVELMAFYLSKQAVIELETDTSTRPFSQPLSDESPPCSKK